MCDGQTVMHEKYVSMLSTRRLTVTSWVNRVINGIENKGKNMADVALVKFRKKQKIKSSRI